MEKYIPMIDAILSVSNPDEVSAKRIRKAVQELFAVDLEPQRKKVNALIVERFNSMQDDRVKVSKEEIKKSDALLAAKLQKDEGSSKRTRNKPEKVKRKKRKVSENGNGINARKVLLSEPLQELLGVSELARTQVVKKVWDHIKENNLQNPEDRREIICDERMKPVFGDKMTMFTLNKILSKHLFNPKDIVSSSTTKADHEHEDEESSPNPSLKSEEGA